MMYPTVAPVFKAFGEEIAVTGIKLPDKILINHPLPEEVLCARIPYFRALFEANLSECTSKEICLSNYAFHLSMFERLLDYAFSGRLTITVKNVQDLMSAANFWQMGSVMDECGQFMRRRISIDNVLPLFSFCKSICYEKIDSHILDFIDNNIVPISLTSEFRQLSIDDLENIFQRSSLYVDEEKQTFEAINRWVRNDCDRKTHAARLLKCVRCSLLTDTFIRKTVARAKWIRGNQECTGLVDEAKATNTIFPIPGRICAASGTINGKEYVAGGRDRNYNAFSALDVYDATTKEWKSLTPMSKPRYEAVCWSKHGKLYVCGGQDNSKSSLNDGECYDPESDRWTAISPMKFRRRSGNVIALNQSIYVMGGTNDAEILSAVEKYDTVTDTWTTLQSMNIARYAFSVEKSCGKIFVFGGYDKSHGENVLKSAEMYDPETNTWEKREDFPITTVYSCAIHFHVPASIPKAISNLEEHWINRFRAFTLKEELIKAIVDCGFRHPCEGMHLSVNRMQTKCIPPAIEGRDVLCQSATETGQIEMQIIAVLQQLKPIDGEVSALFLCTTREQTQNHEQRVKLLSKYLENIQIASFVGGSSTKKDAEVLRKNQPHIVIGTPARIYALIQSGSLDLNSIKHLVIDDADAIINHNGICTTVEKIFNSSSKKKQVIITTNTMNKELRRFCEKFMETKPRRFEFLKE